MREMRRIPTGTAMVLLCWIATAAAAEQAVMRSFPLPDHGTLQLNTPAAWKDEVQQPPNRLPPTVSFRPQAGAPFEVSLTPLWPARKDIPLPDTAWMRQQVRQAAERIRTGAAEATLEVREFQAAAGPGYYFTATDRAPKPGEYKFLTQGMMRVGTVVVTFTILTNDGQAGIVSEALGMLMGARHVEPAG